MTQEKINIAELLKDCPKGMELSSPVYKNLTYDYIDEEQARIYCKVDSRDVVWFSIFGCVNLSPNAKCVIFPKGKTTWKGFVPFVEGDIIYTMGFIAILSNITEDGVIWYHCHYCIDFETFVAKRDTGIGSIKNGDFRLATEEEKQLLFDAIKAGGYKWNSEAKTLEKLIKPNFKVGDRIVKKNSIFVPILITQVGDEFYYSNTKSSVGILPISEQDEYELIPNKFDINTLKPFDKVLVRGGVGQKWTHDFFGFVDNDRGFPFVCVGHYTTQCIPYEGNEHLLGKTDDCDDFYKFWE